MPLPYVNRLENQLRLRGVMPLLHWERFRPTQGDTTTFAWWCLSICAFAVIASLGIDAFRIAPGLLVLLLAADIFRWWYRFSAGQWYVPNLRFLAAPWTILLIITLVLPMTSYAIHPTAWWGTVIAIITWRVIRVGQKIRTHYLDYALEHHGLSVPARTQWQSLRNSDWRNGQAEPMPSRPLSLADLKRFREAVLALRGQGRDEVAYAVFAAFAAALCMKVFHDLGYVTLRGKGVVVLCSVGIASIGIWPIAFQRHVTVPIGELWDATWHAIHVFCHSPASVPAGARAPWSERSRYGDAANRQSYLVWNVVAITLLVLSATIFYPLISDPLRDSKLGEYPLFGTLGTIRLLELRFDRILTSPEQWLYFGAMWLVPPAFIATSLMAIVGSTARGARVLFENDDALVHESYESPVFFTR